MWIGLYKTDPGPVPFCPSLNCDNLAGKLAFANNETFQFEPWMEKVKVKTDDNSRCLTLQLELALFGGLEPTINDFDCTKPKFRPLCQCNEL